MGDVKRALQNTQNDCQRRLYRVHQIRFRSRLCHGPRWGGAYSAPLDCLSVLLSGREGEGTHIPGSAPERRIADSAPNTRCRNDSSSLGARRLEYKAVFDLPNRDSGWIQ